MLGRWQSFPWHGPIVASCSASRARSSRSPRRSRASCPSWSRPRRRRRSTCPCPRYAGSGATFAEPFAGHAADRLDAGRELRRDEDAERRRRTRPARPPARAASTRAGARPDATSRSQSMLSPSSDEPSHATLPPCAASSRGRASRRSTTLGDRDAGLAQLVRDLERLVVGAEHDRALARLDREVADRAAARRPAASRRRGRSPGRRAAARSRRSRRRSARRGSGRGRVPASTGTSPPSQIPSARAGASTSTPSSSRSAVPRVLVDEHDARARRRRRERGGTPRLAAADDQHARPAVLDVVAARVPGVRVELPEPGGARAGTSRTAATRRAAG